MSFKRSIVIILSREIPFEQVIANLKKIGKEHFWGLFDKNPTANTLDDGYTIVSYEGFLNINDKEHFLDFNFYPEDSTQIQCIQFSTYDSDFEDNILYEPDKGYNIHSKNMMELIDYIKTTLINYKTAVYLVDYQPDCFRASDLLEMFKSHELEEKEDGYCFQILDRNL